MRSAGVAIVVDSLRGRTGRLQVRGRVIINKPTLEPERAIKVLQQLINRAETLRQEPAESAARDQWRQAAEGALIAALGQPHQLLGEFRDFMEVTSSYDPPEEQREAANIYMGYRLNALKTAVEQLGWQVPEIQLQSFFPAGSPHDAHVEIRKILASVTSEVLIVDTWVDETLWIMLANAPAIKSVQILTKDASNNSAEAANAAFALEGQKFAKQHGKTVQVRTTKDVHDRFIVVDRSKCWHLGASIKDAGNKAFMLSEMTDPRTVPFLRKTLEDTWNAATPVP